MQRASVSLKSGAALEKYIGFQQEINSAAKNVKELELRMAIVAPMKTGKSTIINAIVGQDLLPSRNAAMTTLPTEIIFNAELSEPTLTLSDELLRIFQETYTALKRKLQAMTPEQVQEKTAPYPHLVELLQEIRDAIGYPTQHKISGHEAMRRSRTRLNDIIRLSSLIEPLKNPLERLTELPRIETPFRRSHLSIHRLFLIALNVAGWVLILGLALLLNPQRFSVEETYCLGQTYPLACGSYLTPRSRLS